MTNLLGHLPPNGSLTLLVLFGAYLTYRIIRLILFTYRMRTSFTEIPSLPRHWIWGNLVNVGQRLDPSLLRHPDYGFEETWHKLGRPPCFLVDLAPVDACFLIVADPTVAEHVAHPKISHKYSIPKSDTLATLHRLVGWESLILVEGEEWKTLRRRFNKGFQPAHLHTLDPLIVDKTRTFLDRLKDLAAKDEVFSLSTYAMDLTTDIITLLSIEKDFKAQATPEGTGHKRPLGMLTASRKLSALVFMIGQGFDPLRQFDPIRPIKSWFYEQVFNRELAKVIRTQLDSTSKESAVEEKDDPSETWNLSDSGKSITRLALAGLRPTPSLIKNTVSQVKSFLFAGQDTTATTIQWCAFELSKASWNKHYAEILKEICAEHDKVFGRDDANLFNALDILGDKSDAGRRNSEAILAGKLPYTTAYIKEILRLHPAAATARRVPSISKEHPLPYTIPIPAIGKEGKPETREVQLNGVRIYNCQYLIHRNPAIWGDDAGVFRPSRWLDEDYMAGLPAGAWRAFERGPRNCIGQELAMLEAKVFLCATARGIEWEKIGYTGKGSHKRNAEGRVEVDAREGDPERELWFVNQVTSIPADGMKMKCKLR